MRRPTGFAGLDHLIPEPFHLIVHIGHLVFFQEGLDAKNVDVAPAAPPLDESFALTVGDHVGLAETCGIFKGPASKVFSEMVCFALGGREITGRIR